MSNNAELSLRKSNVSIQELVMELDKMERRKLDLIVPSKQLIMVDNNIELTTRPGSFTPTGVMDRQMADKLKIPFKYYERMKQENKALLDQNVNSWLLNNDAKNYLIRAYLSEEPDNGGINIGRAFLSDQYKAIDNFDVIQHVLTSILETGLELNIESCDITEKKMYIRFVHPEAQVNAKEFLKNYRNPNVPTRTGDGVCAGFVLSNSEVGLGSLAITPRGVVLACDNGMVGHRYAKRHTHVGAKLEVGDVDWSKSTKTKNIELIKSQVTDYVLHFSSEKFLKQWIDDMTEKASEPLLYPVEACVSMAKEVGITSEEGRNKVLEYFLSSGEKTVGGIGQAITYFAHSDTESGDERYELESAFETVLDIAKKFDKQAVTA